MKNVNGPKKITGFKMHKGNSLFPPFLPITLRRNNFPELRGFHIASPVCSYWNLYRCNALAKPASRHPVFPITLLKLLHFSQRFYQKDVPLKHFSERIWQLFKHQLKFICFPLLPVFTSSLVFYQDRPKIGTITGRPESPIQTEPPVTCCIPMCCTYMQTCAPFHA